MKKFNIKLLIIILSLLSTIISQGYVGSPTAIERLEKAIKTGNFNSWNDWRATCKDSTIDLRGIDLRNISFKDVDFRNTDLSGERLSGANFINCDLSFSNLSWANLDGANLSGSNFEGVNLNRARMINSNLENACLRKATFHVTILSGINVDNTDFDSTIFSGTIIKDINFCKSKNLKLSQLCDLKFIDNCILPEKLINTLLSDECPQKCSGHLKRNVEGGYIRLKKCKID